MELDSCLEEFPLEARTPDDQLDAGFEDSEDIGVRIPVDQSEAVLDIAGLELFDPESASSVNRRFSVFGG